MPGVPQAIVREIEIEPFPEDVSSGPPSTLRAEVSSYPPWTKNQRSDTLLSWWWPPGIEEIKLPDPNGPGPGAATFLSNFQLATGQYLAIDCVDDTGVDGLEALFKLIERRDEKILDMLGYVSIYSRLLGEPVPLPEATLQQFAPLYKLIGRIQ